MNSTTRYLLIAAAIIVGGLAALASFALWLSGWASTVGWLASVGHGWPNPLAWSWLIGRGILLATAFLGGLSVGVGGWSLYRELRGRQPQPATT